MSAIPCSSSLVRRHILSRYGIRQYASIKGIDEVITIGGYMPFLYPAFAFHSRRDFGTVRDYEHIPFEEEKGQHIPFEKPSTLDFDEIPFDNIPNQRQPAEKQNPEEDDSWGYLMGNEPEPEHSEYEMATRKYQEIFKKKLSRPKVAKASTMTESERRAVSEILGPIWMKNSLQASRLNQGLGTNEEGTSSALSPIFEALLKKSSSNPYDLHFDPKRPDATSRGATRAQASKSKQYIEQLSKLKLCATDLEVWNFMEKHVFKLARSPSLKDEIEEDEQGPNFVVPLANYADMIEAAMIFLREEFGDYGGAISIFERVKQLGAESYVLGCSTEVYNELIKAKWIGFRDMRRIAELLEEMDVNCISVNYKTVEIVQKAIAEARAFAVNNSRPGGQSLWSNKDATAQINRVSNLLSKVNVTPEEIRYAN